MVNISNFMKRILIAFAFLASLSTAGRSQDWIRTGTGLGVEKVRLAAPDFKPAGSDPQTAGFLKTFNDTLWNDLDNAGIFEMVSKSFYPLQVPGNQQEMRLPDWATLWTMTRTSAFVMPITAKPKNSSGRLMSVSRFSRTISLFFTRSTRLS